MAKEMRIVQVCEPVFLYICELNRLRREGIPATSSAVKFGAVRHRIESLLAQCVESARTSNHLEQQWKDIERPFYCFIDYMVEEILGQRPGEDEPLPAAVEWADQRLAERFDIVAGNTAFVKYLQADLDRRENDVDARERLEFYYACLGLGFVGPFQDDSAGLNACKQDVTGRVPHLLTKGADDQFTPHAYEHVNPARLNLEPQPLLWGVVIVTVVILLFFFIATGWLYKDSARSLEAAIQSIIDYGNRTPGLH